MENTEYDQAELKELESVMAGMESYSFSRTLYLTVPIAHGWPYKLVQIWPIKTN